MAVSRVFLYITLQADTVIGGRLLGKGVDPHRKFGWMVRSSLDTGSAMVCAAVHGVDSAKLPRSILGRASGRFTLPYANF